MRRAVWADWDVRADDVVTNVLPAAPATQVGGFMPAASARQEFVRPMRQAVVDHTSMCWLPIPGTDPWRLCMLRTGHDMSCLPVPPDRGNTAR